MDIEPEGGPAKKPQRPTSRPAVGTRKPAAGAKPTPKPTAKPGTKATRTPATQPDADTAVVVAGETAEDVRDSDSHGDRIADEQPRERLSVPRLSVARLSLPKLTIPKLALPGLAARPAAPSTTEDAVVEAHAAEEAEADKANADEADPDKADPDKADPDKANADEPGVIEDSIAEPVEAPTEAGEPTDEPATDEPAADDPAADEPAANEPIEERAAAEPAEPDSSVAASSPAPASTALSVRGLTKSFDGKLAVDGIDLDVHVGAFYGIVGPNGAGKTTTLSMITGLLRPTAGTITVNGADVWSDPVAAKRAMGVLPDRLRLFDRLTGSQVLYYAGVLRGLDAETVRKRTADLAQAFGLEESLGRLVTDYSAGMTKKIALAAAMIHTPRLLVLDEPFESVDPVSAATVTEILKNYVANGGTVVLSSHSMDLVQRICDHVAVIVNGVILADGTMAEVRNGLTLEERFVELAGGRKSVEGLEWLHTFSD